MKNLLTASILILTLIFIGCDNSGEKARQLEGEWTSYSIARGGERVSQQAVFNFEDGKYTYDIGSHHEEGDYWIEGDKLYTEGPNVMKKKVQIEKFESDTLVLNMNDKGVPMKMAFERK